MTTPKTREGIKIYAASLFSDDEFETIANENKSSIVNKRDQKVSIPIAKKQFDGNRNVKSIVEQNTTKVARKHSLGDVGHTYSVSLSKIEKKQTALQSPAPEPLGRAQNTNGVEHLEEKVDKIEFRRSSKLYSSTAASRIRAEESKRSQEQLNLSKIAHLRNQFPHQKALKPPSQIQLDASILNDEEASETSSVRNVRVILRCCPASVPSRETSLIIKTSTEIELHVSRSGESLLDCYLPITKKTYFFDKVLGPECDQGKAFEEVVVVVDRFIKYKIPGAIMAYGQTATGKSHTMGLLPKSLVDTGLGCVPRAVTRIFRETKLVDVSAYELYLDQIHDLLRDNVGEISRISNVSDKSDDKSQPLKIHERNGRFWVPGLAQITCDSAEMAWNTVKKAIDRRRINETEMNSTSSRSHTVITLSIEGCELCFVDLAGSERIDRTLSDRREAAFINSSLSSLGNVVRSLGISTSSTTTSTSTFVPFRDSKLTRLLQGCLSQGNAALFATVSIDPDNALETLSTLKFASQCLSLSSRKILQSNRTVIDTRSNHQIPRDFQLYCRVMESLGELIPAECMDDPNHLSKMADDEFDNLIKEIGDLISAKIEAVAEFDFCRKPETSSITKQQQRTPAATPTSDSIFPSVMSEATELLISPVGDENNLWVSPSSAS
jgi:hypothetical protein